MKTTNAKDLLNALNNSHCWTFEGWNYADGIYPIARFAQHLRDCGVTEFEVLNEVENDSPRNFLILCGEEGTDLEFGGQKTSCNVIRFRA